MQVLVSTKKTQKQRENDFNFVPENELLYFGIQCGERVDGSCGCRRSLTGVTCLQATTTMKVADTELDEAGLAETIHRALKKTGTSDSLDNARDRKRALRMARELVAIAERHPVGTVLERRGGRFNKRG